MTQVDSLRRARRSVWSPGQWFIRLPALVARETGASLANLRRSWRVLWALTFIESRRKYAGSILGMIWYPTYAAVLQMRFDDDLRARIILR